MKTIKKILSVVVLTLTLGMCNTTPKQVDDRFIVDMSSPQIPVGEFETQIDRTFPLSGLKKIVVTVSYYPFDDAVCLRYRSDFFTYYQFWSHSGREVFLKALETYNADYAKRDLDMRARGTKSKYGTVEGYLSWQMQSFTRRVSANMNIDMGYAFNDRSPFYAVTQKHTTYEDPISEENNMASQEITMYFTRAQAQEVAAIFDQEVLLALVPPELRGRSNRVNPNIDYDDYYNDYDDYNDASYADDSDVEDSYDEDSFDEDPYDEGFAKDDDID